MARTFDFDRETAVRPLGDGRFESRLDRAWWVHRGPNGGYLAAIVLRALTEAVGDAERSPRSLTVHYVAPPAEGALEVATTIERAGRSLTSCSARLTQDGKLIGLALGAFSKARAGPEFSDLRPPAAPAPDRCEVVEVPTDDPFIPDIAMRWENRIVRGGFPQATGEAVITRWIRLPEGRVVDGLVAAAITDAVIPAVFGRVEAQIIVPTVDLTIHFRSSLPLADAKPEDYVLADFRTNVVAEGFLEEDGEIWSRDGVLLAQSRQLAAILPMPG
ncbi:MAG TPA: thioesterase family protein [Acidimicrobiia bacterium]|nr:thioesterase family protein [Acidimicrobiia bacterium]